MFQTLHVSLQNCDMTGCDLQHANLRGSNLAGAIFHNIIAPLHMSQTVNVSINSASGQPQTSTNGSSGQPSNHPDDTHVQN